MWWFVALGMCFFVLGVWVVWFGCFCVCLFGCGVVSPGLRACLCFRVVLFVGLLLGCFCCGVFVVWVFFFVCCWGLVLLDFILVCFCFLFFGYILGCCLGFLCGGGVWVFCGGGVGCSWVLCW